VELGEFMWSLYGELGRLLDLLVVRNWDLEVSNCTGVQWMH